MIERLTSKENPHIKQLAGLLKQKKDREETGLFVCEGARLCGDAVGSGVVIRKAFVTPEAMIKYSDQVGDLAELAEEFWEIPEGLAHWVADTKSPQGLFAVCEQRDHRGENSEIKTDGSYLLMDRLQDPGNVGTILRTALSLGVDGVFLSDDCAELYSPKVLRASMGAVLKIPIETTSSMGDCVEALKEQGVRVYAAAVTETAKPIARELFSGGCGILLGNEGAGLSEELIDRCHESVVIPMEQGAESLNVAGAAAILIWEMIQGKRQEKE